MRSVWGLLPLSIRRTFTPSRGLLLATSITSSPVSWTGSLGASAPIGEPYRQKSKPTSLTGRVLESSIAVRPVATSCTRATAQARGTSIGTVAAS